MNVFEDPIVAEAHAAREAIFARCGYDHTKFNAHMREVSEQLKDEGWTFTDRPIVRTKPQDSFIVREEPPASAES